MTELELSEGFSIEELQEIEEFTSALAEEGGCCSHKCDITAENQL
jgi:hypothetical protein